MIDAQSNLLEKKMISRKNIKSSYADTEITEIIVVYSTWICHSKNVKININGGKYLCETAYSLQKQI